MVWTQQNYENIHVRKEVERNLTTNQLKFWELQETKRAHRVDEQERNRSNVANEKIKSGTLDETIRSNQVREAETMRSNMVKESETMRSNMVKERETERSNRVKEVETQRHNQAQEDLSLYDHDIKYYKAASEATKNYASAVKDIAQASDYGGMDLAVGGTGVAGVRSLVAIANTESDARLQSGNYVHLAK